MSARVVYVTEKQLLKKIRKLHRKHPRLGEALSDPDFDKQDCMGCQSSWIGYEYGWDLVPAFDDLMECHNLLGTKP